MMLSHLVLPHAGHLQQVLQIFSYVKHSHNTKLVHDPSDPVMDMSQFVRRDWMSCKFGHIEGIQELPPNILEPCGLGFVMMAKVNADNASDTVTRRLRTGFLVYINSALVHWWSKKQTSVESSSFLSEFIVMKQCCGYVCGLRYKLRMMVVLCEQLTFILTTHQFWRTQLCQI